MSKRFARGLVVGKFAPLHRGHEHLIQQAFEQCAEVLIISYCRPEFVGCEAERREQWLTSLFPTARVLLPTDALLASLPANERAFQEVPSNDAPESVHRCFCGYLCTAVLGLEVGAVFTSEDYGAGFAEELTRWFQQQGHRSAKVQPVLVDRERLAVPVSGTLLRQDIHAHRRWLSPQVYASFVQRVCLLGGESSGKTALAQALATQFDTVWVAEYGRELWERKNGQLTFEEMAHIAERQVALEEEAAGRSNRYLFCDTSPLTTRFYSQHLFGRVAPQLDLLAKRAYDLVVLCLPDFPFVQDGTRQPESFRTWQYEWYLRELKERAIPFLTIGGSIEERVAAVVTALTSRPGRRR